MSRRRRIFIAFAAIMVRMMVIVVGVVATLTRSEWGTAKLVNYAIERVKKDSDGELYMGRISGRILAGVTIHSVEIRDENDSIFIAAARVQMEYDPRDLLDQRLLLKRVRFGRLTGNIFE